MSGVLLRVLADAAVRSTIAAALVAAALGALRVRSSAARHAAWTAVVAAMLAMPVLSRVAPAIALPLPAGESARPALLLYVASGFSRTTSKSA